ncbi:MAG: CHRD domain-containing protein [Bryobacteraceae bacterium]
MKPLIALLSLGVFSASAQVVETRVFRALMSPANEVPEVTGLTASGVATLSVHVMKTTSGQILSGSVDFVVDHNFAKPATITGLHIHSGQPGLAGPVTVDTGISSTSSVEANGPATIERQVQVLATNRLALDTLTAMFSDPSGHYVNLHTMDNPGGAIRGQLMKAETVVVMGMMSPANEVPAINIDASATGAVWATVTRDASGAINSGQVTFDVAYAFPGKVTFTGLHVHTGAAGVNGPVTLNSSLTRADSADNGRGTLHFRNEIDVRNAASLDALQGLFSHPRDYYINLHTVDNPGGVVRAQVRATDASTFTVRPSPNNEVPSVTGLDASAIADVRLHTLRGEDGAVRAGLVVFDADYRFPGDVEFTGMHVHDGPATDNGPVRLDSGLSSARSVKSATGFGNIWLASIVSTPEGLATMNSVLSSPELHYFNIHTTANPGGALRTQMGTARTASPVVNAVISAAGDASLKVAAPGELISVYGTGFARMQADLSGWLGARLPTALNGVSVTIAGRAAPLLFVGTDQINAQVPFETGAGEQQVIVRQGSASSVAVSLQVSASAPALFMVGNVGAVVKLDGSLVTATNQASVGDVLIAFGTGFGQTNPPLETGLLASTTTISNFGPVVVTLSGNPSEVLGAAATPGFVGLYQIAFRVPAGANGNAAMIVRMGNQQSNTVSVLVK